MTVLQTDPVGRVHRRRPAAVRGLLVVAVVLALGLDSLVPMTFLGKRLWHDDRLFREGAFTTPLVLWLVLLVAVVGYVALVAGDRVAIGQAGIMVRRGVRTRRLAWSEVRRVLVVEESADARGGRPRGPAERQGAARLHERLVVLGEDDKRVVTLRGAVFGPEAQDALVLKARRAGVAVQSVGALRPAELWHLSASAVSFLEAYPVFAILPFAVYYVVQHVVFFTVWGM